MGTLMENYRIWLDVGLIFTCVMLAFAVLVLHRRMDTHRHGVTQQIASLDLAMCGEFAGQQDLIRVLKEAGVLEEDYVFVQAASDPDGDPTFTMVLPGTRPATPRVLAVPETGTGTTLVPPHQGTGGIPPGSRLVGHRDTRPAPGLGPTRPKRELDI